MKTIFDAHNHINFPHYEKDRDLVIKRAVEVGIKMICVGTEEKTSASAIILAEKYPNDIWATVGYHPHDAEKCDIKSLEILAVNKKVIAIGECGFDYFRNLSSKESQKKIFQGQIELAKKYNKPMMIHCRSTQSTDDAYEDALTLLKTEDFKLKTIFHFYAGSLEMAKKLLEHGSYFTFGGVITFLSHKNKREGTGAGDYDEIVKYIPIENIMLETDAPYVAPEPYRGERNEPFYVLEVAKKVAKIKNLSYDEVLEKTTNNVNKVFKIS